MAICPPTPRIRARRGSPPGPARRRGRRAGPGGCEGGALRPQVAPRERRDQPLALGAQARVGADLGDALVQQRAEVGREGLEVPYEEAAATVIESARRVASASASAAKPVANELVVRRGRAPPCRSRVDGLRRERRRREVAERGEVGHPGRAEQAHARSLVAIERVDEPLGEQRAHADELPLAKPLSRRSMQARTTSAGGVGPVADAVAVEQLFPRPGAGLLEPPRGGACGPPPRPVVIP